MTCMHRSVVQLHPIQVVYFDTREERGGEVVCLILTDQWKKRGEVCCSVVGDVRCKDYAKKAGAGAVQILLFKMTWGEGEE